jgi:hypothetical protein
MPEYFSTMMNKNYDSPINIEVDDILHENTCSGTKVTITFPLQATLPPDQ